LSFNDSEEKTMCLEKVPKFEASERKTA